MNLTQTRIILEFYGESYYWEGSFIGGGGYRVWLSTNCVKTQSDRMTRTTVDHKNTHALQTLRVFCSKSCMIRGSKIIRYMRDVRDLHTKSSTADDEGMTRTADVDAHRLTLRIILTLSQQELLATIPRWHITLNTAAAGHLCTEVVVP